MSVLLEESSVTGAVPGLRLVLIKQLNKQMTAGKGFHLEFGIRCLATEDVPSQSRLESLFHLRQEKVHKRQQPLTGVGLGARKRSTHT